MDHDGSSNSVVRALPIRRRTFLVGTTSLFAVQAVPAAIAQGGPVLDDGAKPGRLVPYLSTDATEIIIVEQPEVRARTCGPVQTGAAESDRTGLHGTRPPPGCANYPWLRLHANFFGDGVRFALGRRYCRSDTELVVLIDNVSIGESSGLTASLRLARPAEGRPWTVAFETGLARSVGRLATTEALFRDFVSGRRSLAAELDAKAFGKALQSVAGGRLALEGGGVWTFELDSSFAWSVAGPPTSSLLALGGRVGPIRSLRMLWESEAREASRTAMSCDFTADGSGAGPIHRISVNAVECDRSGLVFADQTGRSLVVLPPPSPAPASDPRSRGDAAPSRQDPKTIFEGASLDVLYKPEPLEASLDEVELPPARPLAVLRARRASLAASARESGAGFTALPLSDLLLVEGIDARGGSRLDDASEARQVAEPGSRRARMRAERSTLSLRLVATGMVATREVAERASDGDGSKRGSARSRSKAGNGNPNPSARRLLECETAAGILLLGPNLLMRRAPTEEVGGPNGPGSVRSGTNEDGNGSSDNSTPADGEAIGPLYERASARLRRPLPRSDPSTVRIDLRTSTGLDRPAVALDALSVSATLYEMDRALRGTDWSTLSFGPSSRSPTFERKDDAADDAQGGTAISFLHPLPQDLRADTLGVFAIFPESVRQADEVDQNEGGRILARVSLDRALLEAGCHRSLVDLRFGFRGFSLLIVDGESRLVADNTACGIIRTPQGTVVDTRPIIVFDLPPQHVMEEAWFKPRRVEKPDARLVRALAKAAATIAHVKRKEQEAIAKILRAEQSVQTDPKSLVDELPKELLARRRETEAESADPFYGLWRERFVQLAESELIGTASDGGRGLRDPAGTRLYGEYYSDANREHLSEAEKFDPIRYAKLIDCIRSRFVRELASPPPPPDSVRSHLSGRSRLAFRVNCASVSDETGVLGGMDFCLSGLTSLARHEPSVLRRAELLARPLPNGVVPIADEGDFRNIQGIDVLEFQGIDGGQRTVFSHMDMVRASLAKKPAEHETSLELVSRLTFSPSQRAVFLCDAEVPDGILSPAPVRRPQVANPSRLWSMRLLTEFDGRAQPADLRIVDTPDYRADALRPWPGVDRDPVYGAPPYGNGAPWLLPRQIRSEDSPQPDGDAAAGPLRQNVFQKLCRMLFGEKDDERRSRDFRTGLSANDRHQLLILSSAYGLPVLGKRLASPDGSVGSLVPDSGQFEPGRYRLLELSGEQAIYEPKSLGVQELSLSSLGASFRHDTHFSPPLPALLRGEGGAKTYFENRPAFDGLSIKRWSHHSLLGRDIKDLVAYKCYSMPSGHQISIVKVTKREFHRTADGDLRALLVQRIRLELSEPALKFPRAEQPQAGRGFPPSTVVVSLPEGNEIADPTEPGSRTVPEGPGLAFWPTKAGSFEPLLFRITVDGKSTDAEMLLVDNVAAGDPQRLEQLASHYNSSNARIWRFSGADLPYAETVARGDTSLPTDELELEVVGRASGSPPADRWIGEARNFSFSGVLEGLGQPPFFPSVRQAKVRLDSVGKLTGSTAPQIAVAYDGSYLRDGFQPLPDGSGRTSPLNPLEVFLQIVLAGSETIVVDVGANGDRTGGIARPNTPLIGISRKQGPVGSTSPIREIGPGVPFPAPSRASESEATEEVCRSCTTNGTPDGRASDVVSIARTFVAARDFRASGTADGATTTSASFDGQKEIAKSFFSPDAKILGTVTFAELLEHLLPADALEDVLPALKQVLDFGIAAAAKIEEAQKLVNERVLIPVSDLLEAFEEKWKELDSRPSPSDEDGARPSFSLAQLFPIVDRTKNELGGALDAAIAETDPLALPPRLSRLFEAGRRFLEALSEIADNPKETILAGLRGIFDEKFGDVSTILRTFGLPAGIRTDLLELVGTGGSAQTRIAEAVAAKFGGAILGAAFRGRYAPIPWPELAALSHVPAEREELARILGLAFENIALPSGTKLAGALDALLAGSDRGTAKLAVLLVEPLMKAAGTARSELASSDLPGPLKTVADRQLATYAADLGRIVRGLETYSAGDSNTPSSVQVALARLTAVKQTLAAAVSVLEDIVRAVRSVDVASLLGRLGELALLVGGRGFLTGIAELEQTLKRGAAGLAAPLAALPAPTEDERNACQAPGTGAIDTKRILALPPSEAPLERIRALLASVAGLQEPLADAEKRFDDALRPLTSEQKKLFDPTRRAFEDTRAYVGALRSESSELFCGCVDLLESAARLRIAIEGLDDPGIVHANVARARQALTGPIAGSISAIATETTAIVEERKPLLLAAAAFSLLDAVTNRPDVPQEVATAANTIRNLFAQFQSQAEALPDRLLEVVNGVFELGRTVAAAPIDDIVGKLRDLSGRFGELRIRELVDPIADDLASVEVRFAPFVADRSADPGPLERLLAASRQMPGGKTQTLREAFAEPDTFFALPPELDRHVQSLFQSLRDRIEGLPGEFLERLDPLAASIVGGTQDGLVVAYERLVTARDGLTTFLRANAPWLKDDALDAALAPPTGNGDRLREEKEAIAALRTEHLLSDEASRNALAVIAKRMTDGSTGPALVATGIAELLRRITRGDIASVVDLSAVRDEIADRLNDLVPTRAKLTYDYRVELGADTSDALFAPAPGCFFEVDFRSEIDLLDPQAFTFEAGGAIGPFNVNLVHFIGIEAIRLIFGGASFRTGHARKFSFDCDFQDFEIGPALQFIQELQESLGLGASGVFVEPLARTPGVRVGYALDIGVVPLGGLTFANVSVALAAELPFTDDVAVFSVSLSRRTAPFMVSALPWAGSGYLSILATPKSIIGFEFGLEFGVGGAFQIGPLTGVGRIQAGFAIRTIEVDRAGVKVRATEVSGTFFAGGSTSIWIFTFSASLYVRLTMSTADGSMRGEAVFSFSFKAGFVKFQFQVRATYGQDKLGSGGGGGRDQSGYLFEDLFPTTPAARPIRYAAGESGTMSDAPPDRPSGRNMPPAPIMIESEESTNRTTPMTADWKAYRSYFDMDLLEGCS